jgi:hypothetical protein
VVSTCMQGKAKGTVPARSSAPAPRQPAARAARHARSPRICHREEQCEANHEANHEADDEAYQMHADALRCMQSGAVGGVRVRRANVQKGRRVPQVEQTEPEAAQAVHNAALARKRAKGHEPRRRADAALADALVVDEPAPFAEDLIEQRHVLGLPLDDVAEEEVRLVG